MVLICKIHFDIILNVETYKLRIYFTLVFVILYKIIEIQIHQRSYHWNHIFRHSNKFLNLYILQYLLYRNLIFVILYPALYGAINNLLYDINIRDLCIGTIWDLGFVEHSGIKSTTTGGSWLRDKSVDYPKARFREHGNRE